MSEMLEIPKKLYTRGFITIPSLDKTQPKNNFFQNIGFGGKNLKENVTTQQVRF